MRRLALFGLVIALVFSGWITFELITEPLGIDVSDCNTRWREGRLVAVSCPGGLPG